MEPKIELLVEKKLVGMKLSMSLAENSTPQLWKGFMTKINEVKSRIGTELYSMQIYEPNYFSDFNPLNKFEKWACAEVSDFENIPDSMGSFIIPEGLYAVFHYKGNPNQGQSVFQYIFTSWLPNSDYQLDERPHFEVLTDKYKNNDPDSEEDIWIPIKRIIKVK